MKRNILIAITAMLLIFGCKEKEPVAPDRGRTLLHVLGGLQADTFRVTLDYYNADDVVIDNFHQHRNFPLQGYADLEAGGLADEFGNGKLFVTLSRQLFANVAPDTIMDPRELVLEKDKRGTLCFVDSFGTSTFVMFEDAPGAADATHSQVRLVNLASGVSSATLTTTGGAVNIGGVAFMDDSPFTTMSSGFHDFEIKDGGNVVASGTFNVSPYTTYTFYVSGSSSLSLQNFAH